MIEPSRRDVCAGLVVVPAMGLGSSAAPSEPYPLGATNSIDVVSPDGSIRAFLERRAGGSRLAWRIEAFGHPLLVSSELGLRLEDGSLLGSEARLISVEKHESKGEWHPPYSTASRHDLSANEVVCRFSDASGQVDFSITLRVHDHGVAARYRIDRTPQRTLRLSGEWTCFRFPAGSETWSSRDEGEYQHAAPAAINPTPDPPLTRSSDPGPMADLPLTVVTSSGLAASIAEADRLDYPRLAFRPLADDGVVTHLMRFPGRATGWSGPGDTPPQETFEMSAGAATPWRVVTIGRSHAELAERSGFPTLLAAPCRLSSTQWISPGKAIRVRVPYTTERATDVIEFACRRKLSHILFDAHWYGDGTDPSDATVPIDGLDMQHVARLAKQHGIGVILYVDRVPAMRQLAELMKTYRTWGITGIKFGFMLEGRQRDTLFINNLVQTCGDNQLLAILHDDLRPAGLERTYPNYVNLEGVRGNEHFPTASHNVTLPFTRCVAGPLDYTICYAQERNQTTNGHQLAMAVVYYSPLTLLYWYDDVAKYASGNWPELKFFDECPTVWDETRVLDGRIGEFVVTARRSGERWFLGAMTNEDPRTISVNLSFLSDGRWTAAVFSDGETSGKPNQTPVVMTHREVDENRRFIMSLAGSGGQAVILTRS